MILNYADIVSQITTVAGSVFPYVAYSATPQQIQNLSSNPQLPAAFVSPLGKTVGDNKVGGAGDYKQIVTENFVVVVLFSNTGDLLAQNSASQIPLYRESLRSAVVNWHPLPFARTARPIVEGDDQMWDFEQGARTAWAFNYSIDYTISSNDAFMPTLLPVFTIQTNIEHVVGLDIEESYRNGQTIITTSAP